MNLIGIPQALLANISKIASVNDPQYKVTPPGFLRMLLENPTTAQLTNLKQIQNGHEHELRIRYMQRGGAGKNVTDRDDCETPITPLWKESTFGRPFFTKMGFHIYDDEMRKLEDMASRPVNAGSPAEPIALVLYELVLTRLNDFIRDMDMKLLSAMATEWGVNVVSGSKNPQIITFGNSPSMNDGIVKLRMDYRANEMNGTPLYVGNGAIEAFDEYQSLKTGVDLNGFTGRGFRFYGDEYSTEIWGANHFGMFSPGSIGLVNFNRYVGAYAGEKGGSVFFRFPIPIQLANGSLSALVLDAQLKYDDCPIFDEEGNKTADRGWRLILSKSYGLFVAPDDMYETGDRLEGVNGTFHYIGNIQNGVIVAPEDNAIWKTKEQA